jgi:dTDP-4-dehydrorhamnose 3,5-epimerase
MKCEIQGVEVREPVKQEDERGWLTELFRHDELGQEFLPAMGYVSMTRPGMARGPHEHRDQADHFCFLGPSTFRLYLWDNRSDSPTYGTRFTVDAGEDNPLAVLVPKGVVHAYKNIGPVDGLVYNAPNRLFTGENRKEPVDEIRHEDAPDSSFKLDD